MKEKKMKHIHILEINVNNKWILREKFFINVTINRKKKY